MKTLLLISTVLLAAGAVRQEDNPFASTKEYKEAHKKGVEAAEAELKEGRATLYTYGLRMGFENLDRKTGLPYKTIAGCVVDSQIMGRASGHNDRISAYINTHGLPPNSFKEHEGALFDLKGFFDRESKAQEPSRLKAGDRALKSPDGKYSIRPVESSFRKDDGSPGAMLNLVITGEVATHRSLPVFWDEGETDLLWGPRGSRFAVLRCKMVKRRNDYFSCFYLAVDLQRGEWLREESLKKDNLRPPRPAALRMSAISRRA